MIGYIYKTTNLINNKMYIGKHECKIYDSSYYGSGKNIISAIKKYGIKNFKNEILDTAETIEELNQLEIYYISVYKEKYKKNCYNIAKGGDGGNTLLHKSIEEKQLFVNKMTEINKKRCSSEEFKKRISIAVKKRYEDQNVRKEHSEKIRKSWSNLELREQQSKKIKSYYEEHTKDCSCNYKSCIFELNDNKKYFQSVKDLRLFLTTEYNYTPDRRTFKKLMEDGVNNIPFAPYHKNKYKKLYGMLIYYEIDKGVETIGDECSQVGQEIGTCSKNETEIEDIVQFI